MRYLCMFAMLTVFAGDALAWGSKGHRLIASLAEKRLAARYPETIKHIQALLPPGVSLASIAACADSIRDYVSGRSRSNSSPLPANCLVTEQEAVAMFPSTGSWHFVNIPVPAGPDPSLHSGAVLREACEANAPCILTQIEHYRKQLKDKTLDKRTRALALMFLVHLVGDLHQPLHAVARNKDRGGNDVFIKLGNHPARLHSLWDSFFVDRLGEAEVAAVPARGRGNPNSWAWESYDAARLVVYNGIPVQLSTQDNPILLPEPAYSEAAVRVVKRRLREASLRLADLLARALR